MTKILKIKRSDGGVTIRQIKGDVDLKKEKQIFEERGRVKDNNWSVVGVEIINEEDIPKKRVYRDAWKHDLEIDLPKAINCQKRVIIQKAQERMEKNDFGVQDFSKIEEEIVGLELEKVKDVETLYNKFPPSIDLRSGENRKYKED